MWVFVTGMRSGFALTDQAGQPTDTLRVMVRAMGAELCRAADLPPEECRNFAGGKRGIPDPEYAHRWFIRNISERLRMDGGATGRYGWAWSMFISWSDAGLRCKRVTEMIDGRKQRPWRYLVICSADWTLTDTVYEGIWKWRHAHRRGEPSCYDLLPTVQKVVNDDDGHAQVVSA